MTISNSYEPILLTGDGIIVDFDFDFKIFAATDLVVAIVDPDTLIGVVQEYGVDYTVVISTSVPGGTVTFVTAPDDGDLVSIRRSVPLEQSADIPAGGLFREVQIENALDRIVTMIQQAWEAVQRAVLQTPYATPVTVVIPAPEANKVLGWNAAGDALENKVAIDDDVAAAAAASAAAASNDAVDAEAARAAAVVAQNAAEAAAASFIINGLSEKTTLADNDVFVIEDSEATYAKKKVKKINLPASAGTNSALIHNLTQASHGFSVGDVVYYTGTAYAKAKADVAATAETIGVVSAVDGNDFTITESGYIIGLSGLTAGTVYFLSGATAGLLTATEPTTAGHISKPILVAVSTTTGYVLTYRGMSISSQGREAGQVVQVVNTQTGAYATGSTAIPNDDTKPEITEGDEYITLAITPKSATNKLKVDVVFYGTEQTNSDQLMTVALFNSDIDATYALACGTHDMVGAPSCAQCVMFSHYVTAPSTSATTFRVRAGLDGASALNFNGVAGARKFGGAYSSSITITEITA